MLCAADTCQCRARVGGGGFEEATKLFGSGEKHVDMNESVSSSSSYLGLASMSRWNQMMGTKREREREERGEENTLEMLAKVLKKKEEKSTT